MKDRFQTWAKRINDVLDRDLSKLDYVILGVLYIFLFLSFTFPDIIVTGNRSFIMQTNPFDFYQKSLEIAGNGANYLPSTFWLYAIWNLPLRLFGCVPDFSDSYSFSLIRTVWYRILPMIVFGVAAHYIKKIALFFGMKKTKAKLCQYLFMVFPCTIFSQFIFSQYDIFTTCLMLVGYYCWLKEDDRGFILSFGFAITFKYQALVYFAVLLVLREKRIFPILWRMFLVMLPAAVEALMYIRSEAFISQVFGFNAASYTDSAFSLGGLTSINPFLLCIIAILIYAYFKDCDAAQQPRFSIFVLNGVGAAFFALAMFNPQWILIIVPFQVFAVMMNKKSKVLILLEDLFIVCFYIVTVNYYGGVNQWTLGFMVWHDAIANAGTGWTMTMSQVYSYSDIHFLYTIITAILGTFFWLAHPKFQAEDVSVITRDTNLNTRLAFLVGVFAWAVPAYLCLMALL